MRYFLFQTWSNVRESWAVVLQSFLMMTISFFLVGAFAVLAIQVEAVLGRWESEAPIIVYLQPKLDDNHKQELRRDIQEWKSVRAIRLVTPKQAMRRLKRSMGKQKTLLQGLDGPLLPASLEIDVSLYARSAQHMKSLEGKLKALKGVRSVDIGQKWFAPLWTLVGWVRGTLWGGGGLLLICACLIAAGTIRMAIFVHKTEIEVMRLLGATERFIRIPFYMEGCAQGVLAALAAVGALYSLFLAMYSQYNGGFRAFTSMDMRFFSPLQLGAILLVGACTGLLGSWIALAFTSTEKTRSEP